jgi:hypothetical protein
VAAKFSGERGGHAPLTWGQLGIWHKQQADPDSDLDLPYVLPLDSAAITVPSAVAAITQVIERHEMLRTRIRRLDGTLSQVVERSGTLAIPVVRSRAGTLDADTEMALRSLREARFDPSREFPVRVLLVTADERVMRLVMVLSHIAADASAAQIIIADLRAAIAGELRLAPPAPQAMDLALDELRTGRRQTQRAARYWADLYRRIPPTMFGRAQPVSGVPPGQAASGAPRAQAVLVSPALDGAVRAMAERTSVTSSTILLAATATLIGDWTGHRTSALNLVVHNRFRPAHRGVVSNMVQLGLFVLDVEPDLAFADIVRRASGRALEAYKHAHYDQAVISAVLEGIRRERGMDINPYCCFNDVRDFFGDFDGGPDGAGHFSEERVRSLLPRTALHWAPDPARSRCRFCLQVRPGAESLSLSLSADTGYLPVAEIERFLRAMETLIVTCAFGA